MGGLCFYGFWKKTFRMNVLWAFERGLEFAPCFKNLEDGSGLRGIFWNCLAA